MTFWARAGDKSGTQEPVTLSGVEFVRRWSLHILPRRFTKTRCFGGWSNARRKAYQALCQELSPEPQTEHDAQELPTTDRPVSPATDSSQESETEDGKCPKCQSPMALLWSAHRPSWRELFYGSDWPKWREAIVLPPREVSTPIDVKPRHRDPGTLERTTIAWHYRQHNRHLGAPNLCSLAARQWLPPTDSLT